MKLGVWQIPQPIWSNTALPLVVDAVAGAGIGGAESRMKLVNNWIAGVASAAVTAARLNPSFGVVAPWQAGSSLRSVGKMSLLIPISTLYASAANSSADLFCAFHPNRAIVPSLPLRFVVPEIVLPVTTTFARPRIPIVRRSDCVVTLVALAKIAPSGIASIKPMPKIGVGIRKITLLA